MRSAGNPLSGVSFLPIFHRRCLAAASWFRNRLCSVIDGSRRIDGVDLVVYAVAVEDLIQIFTEWVVESHSRVEMGVSD